MRYKKSINDSINDSINRRGIAVLTIIFFMAFSFSCQSIKSKRVETTSFKKGKVTKIYQVQLKSGKRINFPKDDPAVIIDGQVKGETFADNGRVKPVSIPLTEIELVWVKRLNMGKTILWIGAGFVGAGLGMAAALKNEFD